GAIPLPEEINHVVGATVTLLERPDSSGSGPPRQLVMIAESGNFRVKPGDHTDPALAATAPGASVTDGTGSLKIAEGLSLVIPSLTSITVIGDDAGAILTYFWA